MLNESEARSHEGRSTEIESDCKRCQRTVFGRGLAAVLVMGGLCLVSLSWVNKRFHVPRNDPANNLGWQGCRNRGVSSQLGNKDFASFHRFSSFNSRFLVWLSPRDILFDDGVFIRGVRPARAQHIRGGLLQPLNSTRCFDNSLCLACLRGVMRSSSRRT